MSYVVFARKWRPQNFDEIIGQEHVATTLKNAIELDRVAHAYLFSGPRGVGKTSAARILAKALNCESGPTPTPCNKCTTCKEITAGISLDCIEIDGASNRRIDEIRDLRGNVKFAPSKGGFKIYIIDEVHMLTPEAFNALLKTLEEPPKHIKFIFATTQPHKLLPTILSRCQRFDFKRISLDLIISKLKKIAAEEKIEIDEDALFYIAKAAEGSMRDAESLLDQLSSSVRDGKLTLSDVVSTLGIVDWELIAKVTEAIREKNTSAALDIVDHILSAGKDIPQFIDELIEHFRNIMVARLASKETETGNQALSKLINLPAEHIAVVSQQAEGFSVEDTLYIIQVLSNTKQMLKNSPLLRVPLELAIVRLTRRESLASVAQILKRLSELETRVSSGPSSEVNSVLERPAIEEKKVNSASSCQADNAVDTPVAAERYEAETAPVTLEGVDEFWPQLLERLRKVKMSAATYLINAQPIKLEGKILTVGLPKDSVFSKEALDKNNNREIIEKLLSEILKKDIKLALILTNSKAPQPPSPKEEGREAIVDDALDLFKGRVI